MSKFLSEEWINRQPKWVAFALLVGYGLLPLVITLTLMGLVRWLT